MVINYASAPVCEDMGGFYMNMQIPDYKARAIYAHLKRIVENVEPDISDTRTVNAFRLARQDLRQLKKYIEMEENKFGNNELCDGSNCRRKNGCVRYIGNIDTDSDIINPYIIMNKRPARLKCPHFLGEDNGYYPQNITRNEKGQQQNGHAEAVGVAEGTPL